MYEPLARVSVQTLHCLSSGRGPLRGVRLQEVPNMTISLGHVWYFGKLVAHKRWLQLEVQLYFQEYTYMHSPTGHLAYCKLNTIINTIIKLVINKTIHGQVYLH